MSSKKKELPKLIYSRPERVFLPEPRLERDPETTDKTRYRVVYDGVKNKVAVRFTQHTREAEVSLHDLYKLCYKTVRRQIPWNELARLCVDPENDPVGKGWVTWRKGFSVMKQLWSHLVFKQLFKLDYRSITYDILQEEERQAELMGHMQQEELEAGVQSGNEEQEDKAVEQAVQEAAGGAAGPAWNSDFSLNPELAHLQRYFDTNPEIDEAEQTMRELEADYAKNLAFHLWWSWNMREDSLEQQGGKMGHPAVMPEIQWGSWPRPYSVIGPEVTKYVDEDDPSGNGAAKRRYPPAQMLDLPELAPPFDFTIPLYFNQMQQAASTWLTVDTPRIDPVKAWQVEEEIFNADDDALQNIRLEEGSHMTDKELKDLRKTRDEMLTEAFQEAIDSFKNDKQPEPEAPPAPSSPTVKVESDTEEMDMEFDPADYSEIADMIDPEPTDFDAKDYVQETPPKEQPVVPAEDFGPAPDESPALTDEQRYKYYLEGLESLKTGLNTCYQKTVYDKIHQRKNNGADVEPGAQISPRIPQQCLLQVKEMLDGMLTAAATKMSTDQTTTAYKLRNRRIMDWDTVGYRCESVGNTKERMHDILGEHRSYRYKKFMRFRSRTSAFRSKMKAKAKRKREKQAEAAAAAKQVREKREPRERQAKRRKIVQQDTGDYEGIFDDDERDRFEDVDDEDEDPEYVEAEEEKVVEPETKKPTAPRKPQKPKKSAKTPYLEYALKMVRGEKED